MSANPLGLPSISPGDAAAWLGNHATGRTGPDQGSPASRQQAKQALIAYANNVPDYTTKSRLLQLAAKPDDSLKIWNRLNEAIWFRGVNRLGTHGRWAFAEFTSQYEIESGFKEKVQEAVDKMIAALVQGGN